MLAPPESMVVPLESGDRLHYLDWGTPPRGAAPTMRRPLLLIHGLAQTGWTWAPIARRLAATAHVLAIDLRGHGLSDSPRSGYELDSLALDALTVLSAVGYGEDVQGPAAVVAGHGLGAMIAATMARLRPRSVAALALVDGGWEEMEAVTGVAAEEFVRTIGDPPEVLSSMDAYLADRRAYDPASWDADQEHAARAAVDEKHAGHVAPVARPHVVRATVDGMYAYVPSDALASFEGPLLIAVAESGAADDETLRERRLALADVISARATRGHVAPHVVRFAGAGHNLMRYRPDELAAALRDLLEDAPAYQRS